MACFMALYSLEILDLGPYGWMRLVLGLMIGTVALWFVSEKVWGRFLRLGQRQ